MATNKVGQVKESIWRDKEFRALTRGAQCTYLELISQSVIDRAGMQPLQVTKWAKGCDSITVEDIWTDLKELQEHRFVFWDDDTEELLVRSYMRSTEVVKQPNSFKNALRCASTVASEMLRHELAEELRRFRRADANSVADEIDPGDEYAYPSQRDAEHIETPSIPHLEPMNPSRTHREPTGTGTGIGVVSCSADGDFREGSRARADVREAADDQPLPSPNCSTHPNGTERPCRACGVARADRAAWDAGQERAAATRRSTASRAAAETRAMAIVNCELCDDDGYDGTAVCDHNPGRAEVATRGIAAVRAALAKKPETEQED